MQSYGSKYSCKAPLMVPKSTFYFSNGSGRDTYIAHNNGGLYPKIEPRINLGSGNPPANTGYHEPTPVMSPKVIHYNADGTGRDSYIIFSSGGMHAATSYGDFKNVFENKLREYKTMPAHCFLRSAQSLAPVRSQTRGFEMGFYPSTFPIQQKLLHSYQSKLNRRLSLPRLKPKLF